MYVQLQNNACSHILEAQKGMPAKWSVGFSLNEIQNQEVSLTHLEIILFKPTAVS